MNITGSWKILCASTLLFNYKLKQPLSVSLIVHTHFICVSDRVHKEMNISMWLKEMMDGSSHG